MPAVLTCPFCDAPVLAAAEDESAMCPMCQAVSIRVHPARLAAELPARWTP